MLNLRFVLYKNLINKYKRNKFDKNYSLYKNNFFRNISIYNERHTRKISTNNKQDVNSLKKRKGKISFKNAFFLALLLYGSYESVNLYENNEDLKKKIETYPYLYDLIEKKIIPFKIDFDKFFDKGKAHIKLHMKDVQSVDEYYYLIKCMILKIYNNCEIFINTKINSLLKMFDKETMKPNDNLENFKKYEIEKNIYDSNNKEDKMNEIHKIYNYDKNDKNINNEIDTLENDTENIWELSDKLNSYEIRKDEDINDSNNENDINYKSEDYNNGLNNDHNHIEKESLRKNLHNEDTKEMLHKNLVEKLKENTIEDKLENSSKFESRINFENHIYKDSQEKEKIEKLIEEYQNKTNIELFDINNGNSSTSLDNIKEIDERNKDSSKTINKTTSREDEDCNSHIKQELTENNITSFKKSEETKEAIDNITYYNAQNKDLINEDAYKVKFINKDGEKKISEGDIKKKNYNDIKENYPSNSIDYKKNNAHITNDNMLKKKEKNNNLKNNLSIDRIHEGNESNENIFDEKHFNSFFEKNLKDFEDKINNLNEKELKNKMREMFINELITNKYKAILMEEEKEILKKMLTIKYNNVFLKKKKKLQRDLKKNMMRKLKEEERILKENYEKEKKNFEITLLHLKEKEIDKEKKKIENKLKLIEENYLSKMNFYACDINMMKDKFSKDQIKNINLENINEIQNQLVNLQNCLIHDLSIESVLPELKKNLEKDVFLHKMLKVLPDDFFSHKYKPVNNNEKIKNEFYNLYKEGVKEAFINENDNYLKKKINEIISYLYLNHEYTLKYILVHSLKNSTLKENLLNLSYALHSIEQNKLIDALKYINELKGNCKKTFFSFNDRIKNTILFRFYLRLAVSRLMLTSKTLKTYQYKNI
ncbi:conserved Plasmodium protein, unknown function [Plasmodium gallinaceum]|uniref:Uncharacterized protein n=1 Tax=Plasmodium gallinaceum TaxID=5849 RepID=A0A1J1GNS7_PLAGA|nr:conserved Plasmodium protein, unknown function [Plasmodium gallinaceum]CRG94135.1 conserved Plasmodium protein, unknown function [Plasmodium gallinaceum]